MTGIGQGQGRKSSLASTVRRKESTGVAGQGQQQRPRSRPSLALIVSKDHVVSSYVGTLGDSPAPQLLPQPLAPLADSSTSLSSSSASLSIADQDSPHQRRRQRGRDREGQGRGHEITEDSSSSSLSLSLTAMSPSSIGSGPGHVPQPPPGAERKKSSLGVLRRSVMPRI
jgi:hypothetical protein